MSKNLKSIKFGTSGETYYVNDYPVQVSGELTEAASLIDFGTFEGLTEMNVAVRGVDGTEGIYFILVINGVEAKFISSKNPYCGLYIVNLKKIGGIWVYGNGGDQNFAKNEYATIEQVDTITSFAIKAYSGSSFAVGTKYALEGR